MQAWNTTQLGALTAKQLGGLTTTAIDSSPTTQIGDLTIDPGARLDRDAAQQPGDDRVECARRCRLVDRAAGKGLTSDGDR